MDAHGGRKIDVAPIVGAALAGAVYAFFEERPEEQPVPLAMRAEAAR
jgi:hypothetical protein